MGKVARKNRLAIVVSVLMLTTVLLISCQVRESTYHNHDADYEVLSGLRGVIFTAEAIPLEQLHDYKIELTWFPRPAGNIKITRVKSYTAKENDEGRTVIAHVDAASGTFTDTFSTPTELRRPINEQEQPRSNQFITYVIESESIQTRVLDRAEIKIDAPRDCQLSSKRDYALPPREFTWPCWRLQATDGSQMLVTHDGATINLKRLTVNGNGTMTIKLAPNAVRKFQFVAAEASGIVYFDTLAESDIMGVVSHPDHFEFKLPEGHHRFDFTVGQKIRAACRNGIFEAEAGTVYRGAGPETYLVGNDANLFELYEANGDWLLKKEHFIRSFELCQEENGAFDLGEFKQLKKVVATGPLLGLGEQIRQLTELNAVYNFYNRYILYRLQEGAKIGPSPLQNKFLKQMLREPSLFMTLLRTSKLGYLYVGSFKKKEILEHQGQLFIPAEIDLQIENTYHLLLKNGPS